jgi:hypothetical protein
MYILNLLIWTTPVFAACIVGCIYGLSPIIWFVVKDYNKNYFPILQDKHNQLLSNHPNVVGWETTNEETKVWIRSMPVSLPSSLFGYPTTIILEQPSKEPYRSFSEEVVVKKNKHNFFQEVWYGFMDRMAKYI